MQENKIHPNGYWEIPDKTYRFDKGLALSIACFAAEHNVDEIIDVGCGNGAYTFRLRGHGFDVDGYDGNPYTTEITDGECGVQDFAVPVMIRPRDLLMSLEVAEHIPADKESVFIENILAPQCPYVIVSWAIEGQGGLGHVNCRNNDYVIEKFWPYGYALMEKETKRLRKCSRIKWFKKSIMVYEYIGNRK
jgi:hypothetical protein